MLQAALRWILPLTSLLVLGPLAGLLTSALIAPDGGHDATPLLCDAPVYGVLAMLGAFILATIGGSLTGSQMGPSWGLASAGFVLAWAAWGTGTVDQILRRTQTGATFWTIAVESFLVGVLGMLSAASILAVSRKPQTSADGVALADAAGHPRYTSSAREVGLVKAVFQQFMLAARAVGRNVDDGEEGGSSAAAVGLALVFALAAGAVGAWLVGVEALKGQTFAAAAVAGLVAAAIGRVTAEQAPTTLFVLVIAVLAVVSPIAAAVMYPGAEGAVRAAYASNLIPVARILPLDWIAGAFVGIPIGLSWAASMTERHAPEHA